jgi:hypothetical protein
MRKTALLALSLVAVAGCLGGRAGGGGDDDDEGTANGTVEDLGGDRTFRAENDPAEQQRIAEDLWRVLASAQCWEATENYMQQYQFYGQLQFRYSGFDTWAGTIGVYSVGWYGGAPAALISTWTEEPEGIAILSDTQIVHAITHIDGSLIVHEYVASTRCL